MIIMEHGNDNIGSYVRVRYRKFPDSSYPYPLFWLDNDGCQLSITDHDNTSEIDTKNHRVKIVGVDLL